MCFGAGASFTATAVLGAFGTATLRQVRRKNQILFALFPVMFAVHQFNEGLLWLVLLNGGTPGLRHALTLGFLIVAYCVWPVLSPLSLYFLESQARRRKVLIPFILLGVSVSLYLLVHLLTGASSAMIRNCSIYYHTSNPGHHALPLVYLAAVFGPFICSSYRAVFYLGLLNVIFFWIAVTFYTVTFVSVWCFFASVLSAMIYLFFRRLAVVTR